MNTMLLQLVVGDEKTETLKEKMKGWVELGGHSSLVYHKKQSLLSNKVSWEDTVLWFTTRSNLYSAIRSRLRSLSYFFTVLC